MIPRHTIRRIAGQCALLLILAGPVRSEVLLGLEVLNPGVTARYSTGRLQIEFDAGFNIDGTISDDVIDGEAVLDRCDLLARYRIITLVDNIGFNLFAGTGKDHFYLAGAGFGLRAPVAGTLHAYVDSDFAYAGSNRGFDRWSWSYFSSKRLALGFLKSF